MTKSAAEAATGAQPARGHESPEADRALLELEARYADLCRELAEVEKRLRVLRTAADLCELCGGTGERWVRGGLYGEAQQRPCPCRDGD